MKLKMWRKLHVAIAELNNSQYLEHGSGDEIGVRSVETCDF